MTTPRLDAVALLGVLALACRPQLPFAERAFFSHAGQALPAAADCERCHQEVYREWRESGHARAWTSDAFRSATHDGRAEPCAGCHAPAPLVAGQPPALRAELHDEGVTCTTCHLSTMAGAAPLTMRGPANRSLPIDVHPVVAEDPLYRSSELCGGCHESTYAEWKAAPKPRSGKQETCQGCHMSSVHRTVESVNEDVPYSPVLVALERRQSLRRHRFAVPRHASEDLRLVVGRDASALDVRVESRLPHALPTGAFGRREVKLFVTWAGGEEQHAFAAQPRTVLGARETRALVIPLAGAARSLPLTVSLRRYEAATRSWQELVHRDVPAIR